jgi:hypothetical protein
LIDLVLASFSPGRYRSPAPKDAFTLSDVREPTLTIASQPCSRRGRYNVERLIAKHGDAKILYLLSTLTKCPKTESANIYDLCKARYEGLFVREAERCPDGKGEFLLRSRTSY